MLAYNADVLAVRGGGTLQASSMGASHFELAAPFGMPAVSCPRR